MGYDEECGKLLQEGKKRRNDILEKYGPWKEEGLDGNQLLNHALNAETKWLAGKISELKTKYGI